MQKPIDRLPAIPSQATTIVADRKERPPPFPLGTTRITPPHACVHDSDTEQLHDRPDKSWTSGGLLPEPDGAERADGCRSGWGLPRPVPPTAGRCAHPWTVGPCPRAREQVTHSDRSR